MVRSPRAWAKARPNPRRTARSSPSGSNPRPTTRPSRRSSTPTAETRSRGRRDPSASTSGTTPESNQPRTQSQAGMALSSGGTSSAAADSPGAGWTSRSSESNDRTAEYVRKDRPWSAWRVVRRRGVRVTRVDIERLGSCRSVGGCRGWDTAHLVGGQSKIGEYPCSSPSSFLSRPIAAGCSCSPA